jgi:hypothetical protein
MTTGEIRDILLGSQIKQELSAWQQVKSGI